MIDVGSHPEGVVVSIRAQPGARRDRIMGQHGRALKVAVSQPPEKGRANRAVIELLCQTLGLKKSQVHLVSGETSRDKRFLLVGVDQSWLRERLAQLTGERDSQPNDERRKTQGD